jgi:hypothetical protein
MAEGRLPKLAFRYEQIQLKYTIVTAGSNRLLERGNRLAFDAHRRLHFLVSPPIPESTTGSGFLCLA